MIRIHWLTQAQISHFLQNNPTVQEYYQSIDEKTSHIKYPEGHQFIGGDEINTDTLSLKIKDALSLQQAIETQPAVWNCILTHNVEENMPFTLADVVFLPKSYIENASLKDLQYTMLHEWIHILQRQHPKEFNELAHQVLGFRQMNLSWSDKIKKKPIGYANPDGAQIESKAWVYDKFMPNMLFHINEKTFQKSYYIINDGDDPAYGEIVQVVRKCPSTAYGDDFKECSRHHMYHPYEIQADTGAKFLISGKTKNPRLDSWWNRFFLR